MLRATWAMRSDAKLLATRPTIFFSIKHSRCGELDPFDVDGVADDWMMKYFYL